MRAACDNNDKHTGGHVCVLPHMSILSHTHMGHPICVWVYWVIPYKYGTILCPIDIIIIIMGNSRVTFLCQKWMASACISCGRIRVQIIQHSGQYNIKILFGQNGQPKSDLNLVLCTLWCARDSQLSWRLIHNPSLIHTSDGLCIVIIVGLALHCMHKLCIK